MDWTKLLERLVERLLASFENLAHNTFLFMSTFGVLILMVTNRESPDVVILVGIAWTFALSRFDFMIQRVGAFIRRLFSHGGPDTWESSPERHKDKWMLVVSDIGCMLPNLYFFLEALSTKTRWMKWAAESMTVSNEAFGNIGFAAFVIGIGLFIRASMMFQPKKPPTQN